MKKQLSLLFAGALLLLASHSLMSQVRFGAKAGLNISNVDYRVYPGFSPKMIPSFQVGGLAEIQLPVEAYLGIGLEAHGKGYQFVYSTNDLKYSVTINPIYLQIPVKLILRSSDGGVFGGVGPYLAYGIAGKVKQVITSDSDGRETTTDENIRFGNTDQDHYRPLDFGISIEFGYEARNGLRITGEYSKGFGDLRTDPVKEAKFISPINNRIASLCVTYFFLTKK